MDYKTLFSGNSTPRAISELPVPGGLTVLVLAPHPDDFDAIAVTLKFLSCHGASIHAAVARTGSGVEDAYRPGLSLAEMANLREREQRRSLAFFGLPENRLIFLSLANDADDQPVDNPENRVAIEALMAEKAPDIVFLPHGNDTNGGHRAMYALFRQAAVRSRRSLAAFLIHDPKTIEMRTDLYMPFGQDEADWKGEMLRCHDTQHQRNLRTRGHGFDDRILNVNRAIARELAIAEEYAEAFEVEVVSGPDGGSAVG